MDKEIISLAMSLNRLGVKNGSGQLYEIISIANTVDSWSSVIEETNRPIPQQVFGVAAGYIASGLKPLYNAAKALAGYKYEELMFMIQIAKMIPNAISEKGVELSSVVKFSSDFGKMNKTAQASLAGNIVNSLGSKALKYIPLVGVLFSGIMAIKNLAYGFREYGRLVEVSSKIGLTWSETLYTENLNMKLSENIDSPDKLIILTKVCKHAKVFVSEVISFAANYIDFCKDFLFLIMEVLVAAGTFFFPPSILASLGIASVDIFISILISIAEYFVESAVMKKYDIVIGKIRGVAQNNIIQLNTRVLVEEAESIAADKNYDFSSWDYDRLYDYIANSA